MSNLATDWERALTSAHSLKTGKILTALVKVFICVIYQGNQSSPFGDIAPVKVLRLNELSGHK